MTITPLRQDTTVDGDLSQAVLRRPAAAVVVLTAPGRPPADFTATSVPLTEAREHVARTFATSGIDRFAAQPRPAETPAPHPLPSNRQETR